MLHSQLENIVAYTSDVVSMPHLPIWPKNGQKTCGGNNSAKRFLLHCKQIHGNVRSLVSCVLLFSI